MWALGCVIFQLVTLRSAFKEDWETRQYLDSDAAFVVPFSSIPSCPDFIQHVVSDSILDLLHKQPGNRPRASDISRFFFVFSQFLDFAKTSLDCAQVSRNHPSYITEMITMVINSRVENGELLYPLATEYEKKGQVVVATTLRRVLMERDALDKYRAALANGVTDSSLLILRADTYFEKGDHDEAIDFYKEAIDVEPNDFWLWHRLSEVYLAKYHIVDAAINACSLGIKTYPKLLSAKMVLYSLYALKGEYRGAINVLHGFGEDELSFSTIMVHRNVSVTGK